MIAKEEFYLGIDQVKDAFNRTNRAYNNALMMLEAEQVDNQILLDKIRDLSELMLYTYKLAHGIIFDNWAYSSEDFEDIERRMRNLDIEVSS